MEEKYLKKLRKEESQQYTDGEVDDRTIDKIPDYNFIYKPPTKSLTFIRDDLNNTYSAIQVCIYALTGKDSENQPHVQTEVANVLYNFVGAAIKKAEEELRNV